MNPNPFSVAALQGRRKLAFYLLAMVVGPLFVFIGVTIHMLLRDGAAWWGRPSYGFLYYGFFFLLSQLFGWLFALFSAFLLWRSVRLLRWTRLWQWLLLGCLIPVGLAFFVRAGVEFAMDVGRDSPMIMPAVGVLSFFFGFGPFFVAKFYLWVLIPAGAATAAVLFPVDQYYLRMLKEAS